MVKLFTALKSACRAMIAAMMRDLPLPEGTLTSMRGVLAL